jgi:uncharacterized membrane protein YfcA
LPAIELADIAHADLPVLPSQFGPPVVMGSVAGAKVNYFIPSWITKTLLLGVLAPMALRMVKKAKFLW